MQPCWSKIPPLPSSSPGSPGLGRHRAHYADAPRPSGWAAARGQPCAAAEASCQRALVLMGWRRRPVVYWLDSFWFLIIRSKPCATKHTPPSCCRSPRGEGHNSGDPTVLLAPSACLCLDSAQPALPDHVHGPCTLGPAMPPTRPLGTDRLAGGTA